RGDDGSTCVRELLSGSAQVCIRHASVWSSRFSRRTIQILAPRNPIVLGPSLRDSGEIAVRHIDVGQFDASAVFLWPEGQYERGIEIAPIKVGGPPGLDDQSIGN